MTNPPAPGPDYVSEITPWPGTTAPKIDPSFQIGTTTITLAQLAAAYGSSTYTLPTASTSVLGGVKVDGSTIVIDGSGIVSVGSVVTTQVAPQVITSSSTIANGKQLVIVNSSSATTVSLPATATDGWPLTVKRWTGSGIVSVTGVIDGASNTIDLANPIVMESVGFVYSTSLGSWIQVN